MSALYSPLRTADTADNNIRSALTSDTVLKSNTDRSATPLLNASAPLAKLEIADDLDDGDDRETVTTPYPGIDDGLLPDSNGDRVGHPDVESINPKHPKPPDPDVEIIPTRPKEPEPTDVPDEIPDASPRNGFGGGRDDFDGKHDEPNRPTSPSERKPNFPYAPGYGFPYGHDLEIGSIPGELDSIPDVNVYQHKKTLAQGMMDLALFSANANQLRYVLESFNRHPYYFPSLGLISVSLILQVAVGIGLIWNATYNVKDQKEICVANRINNFTVIGIFLVTVINVFISAFGVANPP